MSEEEINARIERLSPQARELFWEAHDRGAEFDFHAPPLEVLADELLSRIKGLPVEEQREFFGIFGAIARDLHEEARRLQADAIRAEGFMKLIERAQELDRQAGRPVNEHMTLGEAMPKLEAAGKLDTLEREYVESVKDEIVWMPVPEEEDQDHAQDERPYENLRLGGMPACPYCGENLSRERPEPEWCPTCGREVDEDHPSRRDA